MVATPLAVAVDVQKSGLRVSNDARTLTVFCAGVALLSPHAAVSDQTPRWWEKRASGRVEAPRFALIRLAMGRIV